MNKLIIFEGQDRVGKDTQITLVKKFFYPEKFFQVFQYTKVPFDNQETCIEYSKKLYNELFALHTFTSLDIIANRSHLGEMVYGPLFRGYSGDYVLDIENKFKAFYHWNSVYLITMVNDPEILIKREDGSSLSTGKYDLIKKEKELFIETHNKSNIKNKLLIECGSDSIESIHNRIIEFLK